MVISDHGSNLRSDLVARLQARALEENSSPDELLERWLNRPDGLDEETRNRELQQKEWYEQLRLRQTALEATASAVVITNIDASIEWVNPAFTKLTGYSLEEARGNNPRLLKSGYHDPSFYQKLWSTVLSGMVWQGRMVNRRKDGSLYTEEMTITPVRDESGAITHFIAIKQDVTEREQAEQLRLEQERLRSNLRKEQERNALTKRLIAALSHDLRNTLTVISTSRDMLARYFDRLKPIDRQEKLDSIGRQTRLALELLDDTVSMLREKESDQKLRLAALNLPALCQISITEVQQTLGIHHHLRFVSDGCVTTVMIDEILISRILINLLSNAVKFSPRGSEIRLELACFASEIMLRVIDHGMGIAPDDQQHIFEPFYRSERVGTIDGTGLGLNIVRDCVERHEGRIAVESVVGRGTIFTVMLPLFTPEMAEQQELL